MIAIIDYDAGNLKSVEKALDFLGEEVKITRDREEILSADGVILGVTMMDNSETPGLGQKVTEPAFSAQFAGKTAEPLTIDEIDAVTGATISSRAAVSAIDLAIAAYREIGGTDGES